MKNYTLLIVFLWTGILAQAQVGVGTNTPSAGLDVVSKGSTNATKALEINNSANTEMVTVLDNGNMGIGNVAPATKLDINNGTTAGAIKIVDGTQGAGRVLTSDANGVGTWSPTPATSLYFLSASPYTGSPDFTGTAAPVSGAPTGSTTRYLTTGTVTNLGPTTTITSGTAGLSYRIPVTGLYRITLYVDKVPTSGTIAVSAYRNGASINNNSDIGTASSIVMINIWNLQAGDYIVPYSGSAVPTGNQMSETTFTVERVN